MEAPYPLTSPEADLIVRVRARRLVVAGLAWSAGVAGASAARALIESPADLLDRRIAASSIVIAAALLALGFHEAVIAVLEDNGRWIAAWAAIVVIAFVVDGPGDELLLPAALGPAGVAGLVGRPVDALLCAIVIDTGYVMELVLHGGPATGTSAIELVAANCGFVLMTVGVIALPVRLATRLSERVSSDVEQWRLAPALAPRVIRAARYPALPAGPLLTEREQRIVKMIGRGMRYAAIARAERDVLGRPCTERTVRKIVARMKDKTGARSRSELVALVEMESSTDAA